MLQNEMREFLFHTLYECFLIVFFYTFIMESVKNREDVLKIINLQ